FENTFNRLFDIHCCFPLSFNCTDCFNMKNQNVIHIENLSFQYPDGTRALHNIFLDIQKDERIGIIGANGAGKSTLALHLNGILTGTGFISVQGIHVKKKNLKAIRQKVGIIFQNPDDQLFCMKVYDDIAFGLRNMGLPEDKVKIRVSESLMTVGLPGYEDRCPSHLSLGEKKRIAIATVYSMHPEVFVLDEPTSSLDPKGRKSIIRLLENIGGTQIIVSHDIDLVQRICTRVIVLYSGKIVYNGNSNEIFSDLRRLEAWDLA
ncbi:MAG: energy-coupling factor ABC transporter ATP-binding protein, partial [Spirochaetota bacterium]